MSPIAGASLLHYRLTDKLREVGMGAVRKTTDAILDRNGEGVRG